MRCITIIGAMAALAASAAAQEWPRYETSLNYTFTRFGAATNTSAFNANGGSAQFAYNFNRWLSGVVDLGAVHNGNFFDATVANYLAGPRFTVRKSRLAPYFQVLFGGAYGTMSAVPIFEPIVLPVPLDVIGDGTILAPSGTSLRITRQATSFAMTAGGGLDIKLSRHVSFRALQVEYFRTTFQDFRAFQDNTQDNLRASAGITFTFGGEEPIPPPPPPPQTKTCPDGSVVLASEACPKRNLTLRIAPEQPEICQGESSLITAFISGADSAKLNFVWSVNGQAVSQGHSYSLSTADRQPGTYTVALTVSGADFNPATAETTVVVKEYQPPTATAKAEPAEIYVGEKSTLSATCEGQCGGNLQPPTFTSSDGSVDGDQFDSSNVQFDPSDSSEQRKVVTITATCADSKNSGTATTTITVIKKAAVTAVRLPDILFDANSSRVNNCGKRILLDQLKSYFERDPNGTVALVGHQSSDEKARDLAQKRAMNAAAIVTAGKGVCLSTPLSQVLVSSPGVDQNGVEFEPSFCSSSVKGASSVAEKRRVEVWFIPSGGEKPPSLTQYQDANSLSLSSIGCPK